MAKASQRITIKKHKDGKQRPILIKKNSGAITITRKVDGYIIIAKFDNRGYLTSEIKYKEGDTD